MKALVWHGTGDVRYEDLPTPTAGADEVLLDVRLAGICGSDLHGYRGHPGPRVPPLVLGHEVVASAGPQRYTLYPLIGCGACARCLEGSENLCAKWQLIGMHRHGVFAEQLTAPRSCLVPVPAELEDQRAVLAEPLACAVGALAPYGVGPGTQVVVIGCGPIGLLVLSLAVRAQADVVALDPVRERRLHAERLGAGRVVADPDELPPANADLVIDAAGFESTWRAALSLVRAGGDVVVLGLGQAEGPFPMAALIRRGLRLRGQFAYSRAEFATALDQLARRDLDISWMTVAPLADGAQAFEHLISDPGSYTKIALAPG